MSTSEQFTAAATELVQTSQKYLSIAGELDGITVTMSLTTSDILATWTGLASSAFALGQKQAARDAYRVIAALLDSAAAMATLAETITQNESAVRAFETAHAQSFVTLPTQSTNMLDVQTLTTGMETAVAAIEQAASAMSAKIADAATNLGTTCSTGEETLHSGQADGVTKTLQFTYNDKTGAFEWSGITNGPPGGDVPGAPPESPGGRNPCSPQELSSLFKNLPALVAAITRRSLGIFIVGVGASGVASGLFNSTNVLLNEGKFDTVWKSAVVGGMIGGFFGPANFAASKYIARCFPTRFDMKKFENYTLTIFGSIMGGIAEGGLLGHYVLNPLLFPPPPAKTQLLDEIQKLEQILQSDHNLTPTQQQQFQQEIRDLQNTANQVK